MADTAAELVLVVDDDDDLRQLYRLHLELVGVRVVDAPDGATGLAAARAERPNLIVLDLHMPEIDGWQVLRELRADGQLGDLEVVVLTGTADEATELRAREAGASSYVVKPVRIEDLVSVILQQLGRPAPDPTPGP
jgi:CheY-like chemotaxis protein